MSGRIDDSAIQVRMSFLNKIMAQQPATPLTAYEMYIAQNMSKLRYYESERIIPYLIEFIGRIKGKVSVRDALYLLIEAYDLDMPEQGAIVLEGIDKQDLYVSTQALVEIFNGATDGASYLLIGLLGDMREPEIIHTRLPMGLNLEAMKNFK